jgi:hypothetical protein
VAQLTYAYAVSQVDITQVDGFPGALVLCQSHLDRFSPPKGWRVVTSGETAIPPLTAGELADLAERIRRAAGLPDSTADPTGTEHSLSRRANLVTLTSRAHLRVVADAAAYRSTTSRTA